MSENGHKQTLRRARFYRGVGARVARKLGVSRTHVFYVIRGTRRSPSVEQAIIQEVERIEAKISSLQGV